MKKLFSYIISNLPTLLIAAALCWIAVELDEIENEVNNVSISIDWLKK